MHPVAWLAVARIGLIIIVVEMLNGAGATAR